MALVSLILSLKKMAMAMKVMVRALARLKQYLHAFFAKIDSCGTSVVLKNYLGRAKRLGC